MAELTAPLVVKNDEKRIVYGPVLIPDEADSDNDVVTAEQIEKVSHQFVEDYGNIDLQHSLNNVGKMVESYILPMDYEIDEDTTVPKGSWMLGVRVTDDEAWKLVKQKKLGGFSIMGIAKASMKSKEGTAEKQSAEKRTTLADLGDDFIVNAVSLVDEPAVPKAKWISIKSKAKQDEGEEIDAETVQKAVEGSLEHRKRLISRRVDEAFDREDRIAIVHSTLEDSVVFRLIDHMSETQRYFQVGYEIDENGNVDFIGDPQEVKIEENVVPIDTGSGAVTWSEVHEEVVPASKSEEEEDNVFTKIMKKFGLQSSDKAGRKISETNYRKLKSAKEVIDDLLDLAEKERQQSNNKQKEGVEMDEKQVQDMIQKEMEPLNSKIDDMLNTMKQEAKNDDQSSNKEQQNEDDQKQDSSQKEEQQQEDQTQKEDNQTSQKGDSSNDELETVFKALEKQRPLSKRLSGQDGLSEKEEKIQSDRNAFGFKRSEAK